MSVQLGSAFGKIEIDTSGINRAVASAQRAMSGFQGKMQSIGKGLTSAGKKMTMGITLPIIGIGVAVAKTASEFESQLRIMEIAARDSGVGIDELRKYALKMGADTVFSASEAADAMTGLFKAGMSAEEVMGDMTGTSGALAAAMDLAAASDLSLAQAADAVSVAIATFGIETDKVNEIANSFVQAADASVAEVGDLTAALANVGPTAAAFGWGLEDVNTALAILSERGIRGSEAGTALKSMMTNIMRPTDDVNAILAKLNINLYDTEGAMRSLPDIIGQLSAALGDNAMVTMGLGGATEKQTKAWERAAKVIPGLNNRIEEQRTKLGILKQELGAVTEKYKEGSTQAQKKQLVIDTLNNRLEENISKLSAAKLAITDFEMATQTASTVVAEMTEQQRLEAIQTLAGTYGMKAMAALLAEGTDGWKDMETAISGAASAQEIANVRMDTFEGAMEALQGSIETFMIQVGTPFINDYLRPFVEWLTESINKLQDLDPRVIKWGIAIAGVLAVAGPLLVVVGQIAIAISALMPVITAIGAVIGLLVSPVGLVVAAIVGLALAWKNNWFGIREKAAMAVGIVGELLNELVRVADDVVAGVKTGLGKLGDVVYMITHPFETGVKAVKKLLGIASESKVFREIANNIMDGLEMPIIERGAQVVETMKGIVGQIAGEAVKAAQITISVPSVPTGGGGGVVSGGGGISAGGGVASDITSGIMYDTVVDVMEQFAAGASGLYADMLELQVTSALGLQSLEAKKKLLGQFPGLSEFMSTFDLEMLAGMPSMKGGGIIPGPIGKPQMIMGHGGEIVTPYNRSFAGGGRGRVVVEVPVYLDGREIARVTSPYLADELRRRGIRALA